MSTGLGATPPLDVFLDALIDALVPVTRTLYRSGATTSVNESGIDIHVAGIAGGIDADPDGRAHPYAVLWPQTGRMVNGRMASGASSARTGVTITCAGGDIDRAQFAVAHVRSALTGARLVTPGRTRPITGALVEVLDSITFRENTSTSPSRWEAPMQYTTSAHFTNQP